MTIVALGINHTTASVDIREKLAFNGSELEPALEIACDESLAQEIAILSTCNRTEIYCETGRPVDELLAWLAVLKKIDNTELSRCHYAHVGPDAARHMMTVASGLDSLVLGEPQILGQMKSCYAVAKKAGSLGSVLHNTFQKVFATAKKVRSETTIGENPVSVAYAAVSLAQQIFADLQSSTALLIGAGETIELVARHLQQQGIQHMIVANRTLENAHRLAQSLSAEAIMLADIPDHLARADIVISSTASQLPLLGKGAVEAALKIRKHKPMFMVDIAVPRDIEQQVGDLSDVYLYTVDDLKEVIDENRKSREQAAEIAHEIIAESVGHFEREQRALDVVDVIKAFRCDVDELREKELQKSLKALRRGAAAEDVMAQLARNLSNKFMHRPTAALKRAGADGHTDIVNHFQTVFELHDAPPQQNAKPKE